MRSGLRSGSDAGCGPACALLKAFTGSSPTSALTGLADERNYTFAYAGAFGSFAQNDKLEAKLFPGALFDALYP